MQRRNLIAAGAILLSAAGVFQQAHAVTSCKENYTCREITADVEAVAPNIIPWDQIWALDSRVSAPAPVRNAEHTAYNAVGVELQRADYILDGLIVAVPYVGQVLRDTVPSRDVVPARDVAPPQGYRLPVAVQADR